MSSESTPQDYTNAIAASKALKDSRANSLYNALSGVSNAGEPNSFRLPHAGLISRTPDGRIVIDPR